MLSGNPDDFDDSEFVQMAVFCIQRSLGRILISWGVVPQIVCGHSFGEITAATFAGAIDDADALRILSARGRLVRDQRIKAGGMIAVSFGDSNESEVLGLVPNLHVAVRNSSRQVVLAGPESELQAALSTLTPLGIKASRVNIAFAAHCQELKPILEDFEKAVVGVRSATPRCRWWSTSQNGWVIEPCSHSFWVSNLASPVEFGRAVGEITAEVPTLVMEVGLHSVLSAPINDSLTSRKESLLVSPVTMSEGELLSFSKVLSDLHENGVAIIWDNVFPRNESCLTVEQTTRLEHALNLAAGANASSRFFDRFEAGESHDGYLTDAEKRLIAEWLDVGAQYYNNPFDVPVN